MDQRLEPKPHAAAGSAPPTAGRWPAALAWPAGAALAFVVAQLVLVVRGTGLGWDEIVYVSQVGSGTPAAFLSAPRARGISWLVAPVAALTPSTTALRVYLALLSGLGLFLALRVWRRLLPATVIGCAGLLFASLWVTVYYGPRAMPNLWCALGALAATGWFLRSVRHRADRGALMGAGAAVAFATLMRPADGVWLTLPLVAAALAVPAWRRFAVPAVLVAGLVVGAAPWVIEAYLSYGGLAARLARASAIQGGMGWHLALDDQVRSLSGRTLCRPCDGGWKHPWTAAWWFALPLLAAGGVARARGAGRGGVAAVAVAAALSMALPYLFSIDYAAPRFLLPTYALLAVPVAECLVRCCTLARRGSGAAGRRMLWRGTGVALAVGLVAHLGVQYAAAARVGERSGRQHRELTAIGAELHRLGVRPPCVVSGEQAIPIAYYAGCASRQLGGHDESISERRLIELSGRMPVTLITAGTRRPPTFAREWRRAVLNGGYTAWTAPLPSAVGPTGPAGAGEKTTTLRPGAPGRALP